MNRNVNILLFHHFESLDVFGPVEAFAAIPELSLHYYSVDGDIIEGAQHTKILTEPLDSCDLNGILVVPGGQGTRPLAKDTDFLSVLNKFGESASYCLSICTGSVLLGRAGLLNNRHATSNKNAMNWVKEITKEQNILWEDRARFVVDGKFYTSSGVSAGIDMALAFIADQYGRERALESARHMEYLWNEDRNNDPFCKI